MALIKCPECNKEISDKATACSNCGFPLNEEIPKIENSGMNVCPRCGKFYCNQEYCPDCKTKMVDCHLSKEKDLELCVNLSAEKQWEQQMREKYAIGSPEFDEVLYNKRLQEEKAEEEYYASYPRRPSEPKITCPYCKSTNINKISSMAKAANIAMFGIFGNKRKYQWHCNNCGSDF